MGLCQNTEMLEAGCPSANVKGGIITYNGCVTHWSIGKEPMKYW